MKNERREFERYRIPGDTLYLFSNDSAIKGWVKDISKGGMAFEYIPVEGYKPKPKIELILAGDQIPFYLPDMSCKTIYDIKINNNVSTFRGSETRLCGVQYEKLETGMKEKLKLLLSSEVIRKGV
jgi:c-di-GMP-binding flagellar brake protein YcgR